MSVCLCVCRYVLHVERGGEEGEGGSVTCRNRWVVVYTGLEDVASRGGP